MIRKNDLADISRLEGKIGNSRGKYRNIFYLENQGIYNLNKPNSLCFGKISNFPVFSLTVNFFGPFSVFPVQWVPCCFLPFTQCCLVSFQIGLGITTLLNYVPTPLAATHQSGSLVLLGFAIWLANELKRIPK